MFLQFHFSVLITGFFFKGWRKADSKSMGRRCDPVLEASGPRHQQQPCQQQDEADTQQWSRPLTGPSGLQNCWSWSICGDLDGDEEVQLSWAELGGSSTMIDYQWRCFPSFWSRTVLLSTELLGCLHRPLPLQHTSLANVVCMRCLWVGPFGSD